MPETLPDSLCTRCGHVELHIGIDGDERVAYCPEGGTAKNNKHTRRVLGIVEKLVSSTSKKNKQEELDQEVNNGISTR